MPESTPDRALEPDRALDPDRALEPDHAQEPDPAPDPDAEPALAEPAAPAEAMTGHPAVDESLRALDDAADAPPAEQIPAYEAAHHVLQQTLATIDES